MTKTKLLGVELDKANKEVVLENILKYIGARNKKQETRSKFLHVVSLNPENLVIAQSDRLFNKIIETAQIKINDGVGTVIGASLVGVRGVHRVTGSDLMVDMLGIAERGRLKALFIGGKGNLAERVADCYQEKFPNSRLIGLKGIKNIKNPKKAENEHIFHIVREERPHIVFAAFGSPDQEKWFYKHKEQFRGVVCMGVGGGLDYLGGSIARAPKFMRSLGFEWLFRLISQPWRIKRQLRLVQFVWLVFKQKLGF